MLRDYSNRSQDPVFTHTVIFYLKSVVWCVSGPKRPHDKVTIADMKVDFLQSLTNKVGFKGFGLNANVLDKKVSFLFEGQEYFLRHGSVVIAAITGCTNTSNPNVMLGAGILARKAIEASLSAATYIKTSFSPGSGVVTYYLRESGVVPYLTQLGFEIVGYCCMTCIGNSGPFKDQIAEATGLLRCLSGNRNFQGSIHPNTRANYLASPLLVIAYAIAGRVDIDFETQLLGTNAN